MFWKLIGMAAASSAIALSACATTAHTNQRSQQELLDAYAVTFEEYGVCVLAAAGTYARAAATAYEAADAAHSACASKYQAHVNAILAAFNSGLQTVDGRIRAARLAERRAVSDRERVMDLAVQQIVELRTPHTAPHRPHGEVPAPPSVTPPALRYDL